MRSNLNSGPVVERPWCSGLYGKSELGESLRSWQLIYTYLLRPEGTLHMYLEVRPPAPSSEPLSIHPIMPTLADSS